MNIWSNKQMEKLCNGLEMRLGNSGCGEVDTQWNYSFTTSFNRLYLVEEGESWLSGGGETFRMEPGKAYLLPAGLHCSYRCESNMKKLYFHFNLLKPDHYDLLQGMDRIGEISFSLSWLEELKRHYPGETYGDGLFVKAQLLELISRFDEKYGFGNQRLPLYSKLVNSAIGYIHGNLTAKLRVEEIASGLFVSRSFLSQEFRKEVGVPIGRYIDEQLIIAAQWKLSRSDDSVESVSARLGYCNPFYFSKCFKTRCGMSPTEFRKKSRQ